MANETEPPVSKYFINFFLFTENKLGTETEEVAVQSTKNWGSGGFQPPKKDWG